MTIVQTQCCQFLKFLIKKELMFFYKWLSVFFATLGGALLFTIEKKRYLQFEKIKSKRKLCTIGKIKTKKLKRLCTIPKVKN